MPAGEIRVTTEWASFVGEFGASAPGSQTAAPVGVAEPGCKTGVEEYLPGDCQIVFLNPFYVGAFDVIFRPMNETHQVSLVEVYVRVDAPSQYRFDFNVSIVSPADTGIGLSTWDARGVGMTASAPLPVGPSTLRVEVPTTKDLGWDSLVLSNSHDGHGWACHWCDVYKY